MLGTWIDAGDYQLCIEDTKILVKNSKGKLLKSVPAKVKKLPEYDEVAAIASFLEQHQQLCVNTVREWFLYSQPIPAKVLTNVWPDESWQSMLRNLIFTDGVSTALIREVDGEEIHGIDLDGETVTLSGEELTITHPAVIEDLDDWRELVSEAGLSQGLDQIFREVHRKPEGEDLKNFFSRYKDSHFRNLGPLLGRCRNAGYVADAATIETSVVENGQKVRAAIHIDFYAYGGESSMRELYFVAEDDDRFSRLDYHDVGPITWSEAVRMCEFVYSARDVS